jgi:hypothetical protein
MDEDLDYRELPLYGRLLARARGEPYEGEPNALGFRGLWQDVWGPVRALNGSPDRYTTLPSLRAKGFAHAGGYAVLIASLLSDRPQG